MVTWEVAQILRAKRRRRDNFTFLEPAARPRIYLSWRNKRHFHIAGSLPSRFLNFNKASCVSWNVSCTRALAALFTLLQHFQSCWYIPMNCYVKGRMCEVSLSLECDLPPLQPTPLPHCFLQGIPPGPCSWSSGSPGNNES